MLQKAKFHCLPIVLKSILVRPAQVTLDHSISELYLDWLQDIQMSLDLAKLQGQD